MTLRRILWSVMAGLLISCALPADAAKPKKSVEMPAFTGVSGWLNVDPPPTRESLRGKVVLVDFWTYSCINCIRTLPNLKRWYEKYHAAGFEIIGVHSPEFVFETKIDNVKAAIQRFAIPYPVALDDARALWAIYGNRAWPTHYLVDKNGVIRDVHVGEGNVEETERLIQQLLAEGSSVAVDSRIEAKPVDVDFAKIKTPEIYMGYERLTLIGTPEKVIPDKAVTFTIPAKVKPGRFYLDGEWTIRKEFALLESTGGRIHIRFDANKANMVLHAPRETIAEVWIDGKPATNLNKGSDVMVGVGRSVVRITEARLYNLVSAGYGEHTLELRIIGSGLEAYTFTFG